MMYLLDVNALIALAFDEHALHQRMRQWLHKSRNPPLATCSITELGFVRILSNAAAYDLSVTEARRILLRLKQSSAFAGRFMHDTNDISLLPSWAKASKQVTDAHLAQLAHSHSAILATLDEKIPGSFLIPK